MQGCAELERHLALRVGFPASNEEEAVSLGWNSHIPSLRITALFCSVALFLLVSATPGLTQKASQDDSSPPKYDLHTEMKTKGVVDEIKLFTLGARKDFTELIVKSGDDKIHIYVCPKPFQEEMGIIFAKGDEIAVTGSKVKQEASDIILAREMVRGSDTLMFRDNKGNPVWDSRTGK